MARLTDIQFEELTVDGGVTDLNLAVTLTRASKIGFIGFSRENAESLTSIIISITSPGGKVFKLIELLTTVVQEVSITDEIVLPAGSIITVVTDGAATDDLSAFISLEEIWV